MRWQKVQLPITVPLVCLLVGNLLDGILTLTLLQMGVISEENPIMAGAYRISPLVFMVTKVAMVNGSVLLAAFTPQQWAKRWFVRFGAILYGSVVLYQCVLMLHER